MWKRQVWAFHTAVGGAVMTVRKLPRMNVGGSSFMKLCSVEEVLPVAKHGELQRTARADRDP